MKFFKFSDILYIQSAATLKSLLNFLVVGQLTGIITGSGFGLLRFTRSGSSRLPSHLWSLCKRSHFLPLGQTLCLTSYLLATAHEQGHNVPAAITGHTLNSHFCCCRKDYLGASLLFPFASISPGLSSAKSNIEQGAYLEEMCCISMLVKTLSTQRGPSWRL